MLTEAGRAKVNLTLRVVGRRVDGYHDLESMVAFADCADRLSLTPGAALNLATTGPRAQDCGESSDNLVFKAARLLSERVPDLKLGAFTLEYERTEHQRRARADRQRAIGGGRPFNLELPERLLMGLVYLRLYCSFSLISYLFHLDESNICREFKQRLMPALLEVLPVPLRDAPCAR